MTKPLNHHPHLPASTPEKAVSRSLSARLKSAASFEQMRTAMQIPSDMWDAFLVTDGSGTLADRTCGYAAVLIERNEVAPLVIAGSQSHGSVNTAELEAVIKALHYMVEREKGVKEHGYRVHVLSDSAYVVQGLNRNILKWLPTMKKNKMLWLSIHGAVRSGLVIQGHHIPRDTLDLNKICHNVANLARKQALRLRATCEQFDLSDFAP